MPPPLPLSTRTKANQSYVCRRFGGFAGDEEFREETQLLMEMVAEAEVEFKKVKNIDVKLIA